MPSDGPREPIIETPTHEPGRGETGDRALRLRVRQQEILAELGVTALKGTPGVHTGTKPVPDACRSGLG